MIQVIRIEIIQSKKKSRLQFRLPLLFIILNLYEKGESLNKL